MIFYRSGILFVATICFVTGCHQNAAAPASKAIDDMNLKRGEIISCGPGFQKLGTVAFDIPGNDALQKDFDIALKLLHSFEYDEAEKAFAKIIDQDPSCAMAYWGVAMSNFHPLWAPPAGEELNKGKKALDIAASLDITDKEKKYITALQAFYLNHEKEDHRSRSLKYEKAMEDLYNGDKSDLEAAILYALALTGAADPMDKTFSKQKKAGAILTGLFPDEPDHPGLVHYIIHTYDYPELAELALPAARKYAAVAPSSAHALHMPSHIFTRLGLWEECINSNLQSVASAKCYAEAAGIAAHWDEELHGMDYLAYAYLQRGDNEKAKGQWDYLKTINEVHPANFKVAYAFASIPSRYLLENRAWAQASTFESHKGNFDWKEYPWQRAIIHFTRLMGSVNTGNTAAAKNELKTLQALRAELVEKKDKYKAGQVEIQATTGDAWIRFKEGNTNEGLALMKTAAELEDKTEKHPVTPGEVLPARELYADMLMQANKFKDAASAYEASLVKHNNRFNGLYGAAKASEKAGDIAKAKLYYQKLIDIASSSAKSEVKEAKQFLSL